MINLTDFSTKEAQNLVTLVRITEDALAVSTKKFDSETGIELSEEVQGGNIKEYTDRKAVLEAEIAEIEAFIAKFGLLKPQNVEVTPVVVTK